jgi:hypothetical protein
MDILLNCGVSYLLHGESSYLEGELRRQSAVHAFTPRVVSPRYIFRKFESEVHWP